MGDTPVDNKAVDVLAAAAGVPTPAPAKSVPGTAWRYRKLALIVGGAGLVAAGGGYGYKYFTANPGKANAQGDPPAVAKADDTKPAETRPGDDTAALVIAPPAGPAKDDGPPPVPEIKIPAPPPMPDGDPVIKPAASSDKTETRPTLVLPPMGDPKKPETDDGPPTIAPPIPEVKLPDNDRPKADGKPSEAIKLPDTPPAIQVPGGDPKKSAGGDDLFKAPDGVPTIGTVKVGPGPLPAGVDTKDDKGGPPVIPVQGVNPPVDVPKVEAPAAPKVPAVDIAIPPPPAPPGMKDGPPADDKAPTITAPGLTIPGPKPDVPPVEVNPLKDPSDVRPPVTLPDRPGPPAGDPVRPPVSIDPPPGPPRIDVKADTPPAVPAPVKRDSYDELWHDDKGETFATISREYFHDPKYAAALEAYNRNRRDKIIRVPPTWVLEERFPNLIRQTPDRAAQPDKTGLKFEPVAPLPSGGRGAPAAVTSRATDEYKVTADGGESIRDVARKALGDANAWKKLYELNPSVDPTVPLPTGTVLRLK